MSEYVVQKEISLPEGVSPVLEQKRWVSPTIRGKLATLSVTAVAFFGANSTIEAAPAYGQTGDCLTYIDGNGVSQMACDLPPGEPAEPDVSDIETIDSESQPVREPSSSRPSLSQHYFQGYDMGASSFTDGNGCFVTATASALRRINDDAGITPRSVYKGKAITSRWSPSGGVRGYLFDALPSIAKRFGVQVKKTGFKGVRAAINAGGQGMVLFRPGYFTGQGHYMTVKETLPNGRVILDDPNGKGRHGDSERAKGWSASELRAKGALAYRALLPRS